MVAVVRQIPPSGHAAATESPYVTLVREALTSELCRRGVALSAARNETIVGSACAKLEAHYGPGMAPSPADAKRGERVRRLLGRYLDCEKLH